MNNDYIHPDPNVLAKYGLKKVSTDGLGIIEFEGVQQPSVHLTIKLWFSKGGMITVWEYNKAQGNFKFYKGIRLWRVWVDNDNELDILLRQTYPLWEFSNRFLQKSL